MLWEVAGSFAFSPPAGHFRGPPAFFERRAWTAVRGGQPTWSGGANPLGPGGPTHLVREGQPTWSGGAVPLGPGWPSHPGQGWPSRSVQEGHPARSRDRCFGPGNPKNRLRKEIYIAKGGDNGVHPIQWSLYKGAIRPWMDMRSSLVEVSYPWGRRYSGRVSPP